MDANHMVRLAGVIALGLALLATACKDRETPTAPATTMAAPRAPALADSADWCAEHAVPESMCSKCNPRLVDRFQRAGDWCAEHGYPESVCPLCNPMQPPATRASAPHRDSARVGDPADWCGGHGLPESMCTKCNPGLVEQYQRSGDWCAEHGLPESVCPVCNPMRPPGAGAAAPDEHPSRVGDPADWCAEHGLPESNCTVCNPGLADRFQSSGDWCAEHGYPESVCPFCNPMQPPPGVARPSAIAPGTRIRFRSPAIERAAGIETVPATTNAIGIGVETTARIDFNRNAMADVRSAVPGIVHAVSLDLGQQVTAGDTLFTLESADVGDLQARRRGVRQRVEAAQANMARQEALREGAIASQRQVELARQELEAAEAELRSLDQSLRISGASRSGRTGRFEVVAPIGGIVVRRPALVGTFAGEADSLATIADTSVMWVVLDVPEWDATSVRTGQQVDVRVDGVAGRTFTGTVTWIASEVEPRTRSVSARAEVQNTEGLVRASQFARATIRVAVPEGAATVPLQAVQRVGEESVVFVRTAEGIYEPRVVRPGRSDGRRVQIAGDVRDGDAVVTTGAFLLRTELSRESIGAGCCEVEGPGGN